MNIQEYIESGDLEAYVMGILPTEEMNRVQADIARHPELAREIAANEEAMFRVANAGSIAPPAGLQDKIWATIQQSSSTQSSSTAGTGAQGSIKQPTLVLPLSPALRHTRFSRAAVWAALVGSMALNAIFWYETSMQKKETLAVNSKLDSMQASQKQLLATVENYTKGKNMMADNNMQTIVMHTLLKGHPMAATLYWSKDKGEAYVMMDGLPKAPEGMQYQLWVIQDGKPVDMGMLASEMASTPGIQKVSKPVASGEAFAISLEKVGGAPSPTAEMIYVMGKA